MSKEGLAGFQGVSDQLKVTNEQLPKFGQDCDCHAILKAFEEHCILQSMSAVKEAHLEDVYFSFNTVYRSCLTSPTPIIT